MDLIRWSIRKPVGVTVGVLLVVFFGLIGLAGIPIQLTPTVDRPVVTVRTIWAGRSPEEIVDEITRRQEERLKNVGKLTSLRSISREGEAEVTLEFSLGADLSRAMQEVSDALRQVGDYPDDVTPPTVEPSEGGAINAIAWLIIDLDPAVRGQYPDFDVSTLYTAVDKDIRPLLERVDGVAETRVFGGRERQVRVLVDPAALALRGVTYDEVIQALRRENANISAGTVIEGKRDIRVRVIGQFRSTEEIAATVVSYRDGRPVLVRDLGRVEMGHEKVRGFVRSLGEQALAMPVIRQTGTNVMQVMGDLRDRLDEVRAGVLPTLDPTVGRHLRLRQVYDETVYIRAAIDLVLENLWYGGALATLVLVLFLRSLRATGIIALAIPVSVVATFLVVLLAGRTLNIVSLAGLAFATGMVVDNAIVVLENITRRRGLGDTPWDAVYRGTKEVWTAILASTLTTVAVFIPILTVREEAGQIFFDLSLAMAVAVSASLVVAVTVVPCAAGLLFGTGREPKPLPARTAWQDLWGLVGVLGGLAERIGRGVSWLTDGWRGLTLRPLLILLMAGLSVVGAMRLAPPLDYLPKGNQNLVFGGLLIPPGLSMPEQASIAQSVEEKIGPYMRARTDEQRAALAPIFRFDAPDKPFDPVAVDNFFIGAFQGSMFCGGISADPQRVIPVGQLLSNAMSGVPDAFGGAAQASIFGRIGVGGTLDVEISGPSLDQVTAAAKMMMFTGFGVPEIGPMRLRPDPANFTLLQPEVRVRLTDVGREMGLRTDAVGTVVRGLFDGAYAGEFVDGARTIDIVVLPTGGELADTQQLPDVPISTPAGLSVPLASVARVIPGRAPQQIKRVEELPAVTLGIVPPDGVPLETMERIVEERLIQPARAAGLIDPSMRVRFEGSARKLEEVTTALFGKRHAGPEASWQAWLRYGALGFLVFAVVGAVASFARARGGASVRVYAALGVLAIGLSAAALLGGVALAPQLALARFVWALAVTYLLMCALFESFLYPFVIMFSVPLSIVGGFGALRLVHNLTLLDPTKAPQQLDVLTMIGFVILIGTVVNNAILIVEQALNFMDPAKVGEEYAGEKAMAPRDAIREAVRTRMRPVLMTTLTTLGGGLPLVLAPGQGSEMYRGLGAVVCGGLLVSTIFTLVLVPLVFSLVLDMRSALATAWRRGSERTRAG